MLLMLLEGDAVEGIPPAVAIVSLSTGTPFELIDYDALEVVLAAESGFDVF